MTHLLDNAIDVLCWVIVLPTLGWLAYRSFERSDNRRGLIYKWIATVPLVLITLYVMRNFGPYAPVFVIPSAVILGLLWAPTIGSILSRPLTNAFDGGNEEEAEAKPFYFIAEGKRRKGLYEEAIAAVRQQLEKFPGDFEGYM